jgi:hypothetical protein
LLLGQQGVGDNFIRGAQVFSSFPQYFNRTFTFLVINSKLMTADEKAHYESFDGGCHVFIIQRSNPIGDQKPSPDNRTAVEGPIL